MASWMRVLRTSNILRLCLSFCLLQFLLTCTCVTCEQSSILVVGSLNADTFLPVSRLPKEGENLTLLPGKMPVVDVPGGKGCTQAVAAAKLLRRPHTVTFLGQFGNDAAAGILERSLEEVGVDTKLCQKHKDLPSGRGYVFLTESGSVSAVISGGSNAYGWKAWQLRDEDPSDPNALSASALDAMLDGVSCIMLQREVPEYVNRIIAQRAKEKGGILVIQDIGGEDRPISREMLQLCDYVMPNETELCRLVGPCPDQSADLDITHDAVILFQAKRLQEMGARNVLVTRGKRGSMLITEAGQVLSQPAYIVPRNKVVDETGAGDCYRSGFAVLLLEGLSLQTCLRFASAAGSCAVERNGAVPSTPSRGEVEHRFAEEVVLNIPRGDGVISPEEAAINLRGGNLEDNDFPFLIGSRLNSMKDRPELWSDSLNEPRDYVKRQAAIKGLTCVDFNYPQHFHSWTTSEARVALEEAGLVAGAVCLRYPSTFARGAMNHPDAELRQEAINLTKQAAEVAIELGCDEVVVWSAFDGYDYMFQVDYDEKWDQLVAAFRDCCDAFPGIKFSLEYKPTDENTRFFTVPSTAAALLLLNDIDRPNMGLTLDVGHMMMAGENPGQSIAMVGKMGKLFGIQLNDGFTRLAAEDGMMFGSVHPGQAMEIMYQLQRIGFDGHLYFDTFPQRSDPVKEAEFNIKQVKAFWKAASAIDVQQLRHIQEEHDAIGALEIVQNALKSAWHK